MTLREKVELLATRPELLPNERQPMNFVLAMAGDTTPLEDQIVPELVEHYEGRFEWFFLADGTPRKSSA